MQILNYDDYHMSLEYMLGLDQQKFNRIPVNFVNGISIGWQMLYSYNDGMFQNTKRDAHTQDFYELIVHLHSSRTFMIEDSLFRPGYGDCILISPDERHMGIDPERRRYERYYLLINPALLAYLPDGAVIEKLFARRGYPNVITFEPKERDALLARLAQYRNYHDLDAFGMMGLRAVILDLLHALSLRREAHTAIVSDTPPLLSEILHHIHTDFAIIESAAAIAARFDISPSYLSRIFRQHLHTSPYQYLMSIRLDEALHMLESGTSVTDACFASGFSDCSHFIAYFHREMGITPSEVRKKHR